jgi:hypothetical protein
MRCNEEDVHALVQVGQSSGCHTASRGLLAVPRRSSIDPDI